MDLTQILISAAIGGGSSVGLYLASRASTQASFVPGMTKRNADIVDVLKTANAWTTQSELLRLVSERRRTNESQLGMSLQNLVELGQIEKDDDLSAPEPKYRIRANSAN